MKRGMAKKLLVMAAMGLVFPLSVQATEADLQLKIDKLSKEVNDLKGSVKKVEDKSLGKWLTVGGDYRFRVDSLEGKTVAYADAMKFATQFQANLPSMFLGATTPEAWQVGTPYASLTQLSFAQMTPAAKGQYLQMFQDGTMQMVSGFSQMTGAQLGGYFTANPAAAAQFNQIATVLGLSAQQMGDIMTNPAMMQQIMFGQVMANGGAFIPAYKPKNETLYTNKFGLDLHAKATQDVTVNVKLGMYKAFGSQSESTSLNGYFADRVGSFDGTLGHVPTTSLLNVDRAYATWSNIGDQPVWFSVGRRPSTNGAPSNLKLNNARPGSGGTPSLLVDYAFDGMTIGWAPDIDMLPGAYAKVCYGRGFDAGLEAVPGNSVKDTDMLGVAVLPIDTDPLRVWLQWNRGFNIFDFPVMNNTIFGNTNVSANLGSIDWYGAGAMSTLKNVGPGNLNVFADFGMSISNPNTNVSDNAGFQGLMTGAFFAQDPNPESKTGWGAYVGARYDLPSKTKIGFEFNHGSKNWIPFSPAADDMWTAKVGTRGNVYEPYIIQELDLKPISSHFSTAFIKIGYQYYDFEYTGSNNWVGAPVKISDIKSTDLMLMAPVKEAHDLYATFEVKF